MGKINAMSETTREYNRRYYMKHREAILARANSVYRSMSPEEKRALRLKRIQNYKPSI